MKKILVIQTGKLGDMVCTTPVFRAIKEKYPKANLSVSGDAVNKQVLRGNPNVDEYILISDLPKVLKESTFDASVLLNPNPSILWQLVKTQPGKIIAPRVVGGFSPYQTKIYRLLLVFVTSAPHRMGNYAPQEYLNMLQQLGISASNTEKEIFIEKEAGDRALEFFKPYDTRIKIGLSPSAGNKIKEWRPERFAELADQLYEKYKAIIFLIGGPKDKELGEEMKKNLKRKEEVVDLIGKLSIEELKAYMKHLDLFIAVDTGPVYIAEALGVATVDIVGPMDEREQPPIGDIHRVVYLKNRKEAALHIMNARVYDSAEARRQIDGITSEMVIREASALIETRS